MCWIARILLGSLSLIAVSAIGAEQFANNVRIESVAVNGGIDAANSGTTCIRLNVPVVASCTNGYIAIRNNNKHLVSSALLAKTTGANATVYYDDAGSFHCPGFVYTSCSVSTIELR